MKYASVIALLPAILMCSFLSGQSLSPADIPFGKITGTQSFEGKALYGYIDGGAELYREYGFVRLSVYAIDIQKEQLSVELYEMENPPAAFGIFSVNRSQCAAADSVFQFSCIDPYQIQIVQGSCFVRIVNETGSQRALQAGVRIAGVLQSIIPSKPVTLPSIFAASAFHSHIKDLRRMAGPLGVQNGAPDLEDAFDGTGKFELWMLPVDTDSAQSTVLDVSFREVASAQKFAQSYGLENGKSFWHSLRRRAQIFVWQKTPTHVVILTTSETPPENIVQLLSAYRVEQQAAP
ncbi:MAG: hypothetical protein NTV54_02435 [Ignavibacteriales bacterium]|nr:hypothetical protein [Ignavibacteriales bacterium]